MRGQFRAGPKMGFLDTPGSRDVPDAYVADPDGYVIEL
jgi:hypothetical protein